MAIETATKILAEMNANPKTYDWSGTYRVETTYAVGAQSRRRSYSAKTHLITVSRVVAHLSDPKPHWVKVGNVWHTDAICNGNGHNSGAVDPRLDIEDITCSKCRRYLGLD